jgi:hypothetical protein
LQFALLISEGCGERGQLSFVPRRKDGSHWETGEIQSKSNHVDHAPILLCL